MKLSERQLKVAKIAAVELNQVLFEGQPEIDVNADYPTFLDLMYQGIEQLYPEDPLTPQTKEIVEFMAENKAEILKDSGAVAAKEVAKEVLTSAKKESVKGDDEEEMEFVDDEVDTPPADLDENNEQLKEDIESAEKLAELKAIAKENKIFEAIAAKVTSYKTADALREALLEVLDKPAKVLPEEEPEEEVTEPEPAPTKKSAASRPPVKAPVKTTTKPVAKKEPVKEVKKDDGKKIENKAEISTQKEAVTETSAPLPENEKIEAKIEKNAILIEDEFKPNISLEYNLRGKGFWISGCITNPEKYPANREEFIQMLKNLIQ